MYLIYVGVVQKNMTCTTGSGPGLITPQNSLRDQVNICVELPISSAFLKEVFLLPLLWLFIETSVFWGLYRRWQYGVWTSALCQDCWSICLLCFSVIGEICLIFTVRLGFMQDPRNQPVDRSVWLSFPSLSSISEWYITYYNVIISLHRRFTGVRRDVFLNGVSLFSWLLSQHEMPFTTHFIAEISCRCKSWWNTQNLC